MKLKLFFLNITLFFSAKAIESSFEFACSFCSGSTSYFFVEDEFKKGDKFSFSFPDFSFSKFTINLNNMAVTCDFVLDGKLIAKEFSPCFCDKAEWRYFSN